MGLRAKRLARLARRMGLLAMLSIAAAPTRNNHPHALTRLCQRDRVESLIERIIDHPRFDERHERAAPIVERLIDYLNQRDGDEDFEDDGCAEDHGDLLLKISRNLLTSARAPVKSYCDLQEDYSMPVTRLTTIAACRVARIDRDRFNEHVAKGNFKCAPETIPGRARLFDADGMLALIVFKRLLDEGLEAERAGFIACTLADGVRIYPDHAILAYVEFGFGSPRVETVESLDGWLKSKEPRTRIDPGSIRKATLFNVAMVKAEIQAGIEDESSIIGPDDQ